MLDQNDLQAIGNLILASEQRTGAKIDALESRLQKQMDERFEQVDERFEQIDRRLDRVDERFEQIDRRLDQVDERFEQIDRRLDRVDERFEQIDRRLDRVDERFEQIDRRFEQVDERFAQIDKRFEQVDKRLTQIDKRFGQVDERFAAQDAKLENRILASETMLLEEMERMDRKNERRFSKLEKDIEELKDIYRMTKNENDTIQMILHIQEDMDRRLVLVEQKIA